MVYAISDIHGDYGKYSELLRTIGFSDNDTLYILGDVIDRGKDGVKILFDMMYRPNVIPLVGNHELTAGMCLPWLLEEITQTTLDRLTKERFGTLQEWILDGGAPTLRALEALSRDEREDIRDFISDMEFYAELTVNGREFVLTHSGLDNFDADKPLDDYTPLELVYYRPKPDDAFYSDKTLIFGHTPTPALCGEDRIFKTDTWIDIDCGCGRGGKLGCLRLDDFKEFYV